MDKSAVFTIVSCNYFHYAKTLMQSLQRTNPDVRRFVLLADAGFDRNTHSSPEFTVIPVEDLSLPDARSLFFKYTILELNTALKPYFIEHLFSKGFDKVVYLDPDIYVYNPIDSIIERLDEYDVVLTPHITQPLDDGFSPGDLDILRSGTFNLGFIALRASPVTLNYVKWWQRKLSRHCYVDVKEGLFVDQKWCDFIPAFIERTCVDHSPGLNAAYWNLAHRTIVARDGNYYVTDGPLVFFHFSGLVPAEPFVFSKHETRFSSGRLPWVVNDLVRHYISALEENGLHRSGDSSYHFDRFNGGLVRISPFLRRIFGNDSDVQHVFGDDPFDMGRDPGFASTYNKMIFGPDIPVTRLLHEIYSLRGDLRDAFPDEKGEDADRLAEWFVTTGKTEHEIDHVFVKPVQDALVDRRSDGHNGRVNHVFRYRDRFVTLIGHIAESCYVQRLGQRLSRMGETRSARAARSVAQSLMGPANTARLRRLLTVEREATPAPEEVPCESKLVPPEHVIDGVKVTGYLRAESGMGESARSTLRAAKQAGIRLSAQDYTTGCLSRMEEHVPEEFFVQEDHAINLFHVNADQCNVAFENLGPDCFNGQYNIGYWVWEVTEFPDSHCSAFQFMDEIWTPSTFSQDIISRKSPIPVIKIPHNIALDTPKNVDRTSLGLPEKGFVFLTMADLLSVPERKNPLGVIDAFLEAFGEGTSDVFLVLKLSNLEVGTEVSDSINDRLESNPSVIVIRDYLDRSRVNALVDACDCMVSLHRSEGFGLTLAEAMYLGKPVIATGWSGNMDFMNISNSLPVRHELVQLTRDIGPYPGGAYWAEPDLHHAADLMKRIVADPVHAAALGRKAAHDIRTHFSPAVVGSLMKKRLRLIRKSLETSSGP